VVGAAGVSAALAAGLAEEVGGADADDLLAEVGLDGRLISSLLAFGLTMKTYSLLVSPKRVAFSLRRIVLITEWGSFISGSPPGKGWQGVRGHDHLA
jgi:hypothetical protein